jgi:hypothetical protein
LQMKNEKKGDSLRREAIPSTSMGPEQQMAESPGFFKERPLPTIELAPRVLRNQTRRDVLLFGVGALAALAGAGFLLPQDTLSRIGIRRNMDSPGKEWFLNNALRIDDDVAEALYSGNRRVPTYTKPQITQLKNNYNGATPDPGYISGWNLTLDGLASGLSISLDIRNLTTRFSVHEQITRLVCVEGWSAVAWWAGLRFDDLLCGACHSHPLDAPGGIRGVFVVGGHCSKPGHHGRFLRRRSSRHSPGFGGIHSGSAD